METLFSGKCVEITNDVKKNKNHGGFGLRLLLASSPRVDEAVFSLNEGGEQRRSRGKKVCFNEM